MLPNQLTTGSFDAYLPEAKRRALSQLVLLRSLPLSFVPLLLREVIVFDWKFPAERRELDRQFDYLAGLSADALTQAMLGFRQLRLSPDLERTDWVNSPTTFSEQLTAHLWATHQIDSFRKAATEYMKHATGTAAGQSLPAHRLGIVVIGYGCAKTEYPIFHKLSQHGTIFSQVEHNDGLRTLLSAVEKRAAKYPEPFSHWCIDGGASLSAQGGVAQVSYAALSPARAALQSRMQKTYESGAFDPEAFRSMLARTGPAEIGLDATRDPVLSRFQLSLLTEGSGTQVFSTTFVQWAAREALRRAQPLTLFARFSPRQREKPMNELLAESQRPPELDPEGSLIDADQGAYYTWLNQQRLSGAEAATFLVWYEDQPQAIAIGPSFERGARSGKPTTLAELITRLT